MASGLFAFQKSVANGRTRARTFTTEFDQDQAVTTVNPTARHQATIVWLHDLNEIGPEAAEFVKSFSLYNVKWICPSSASITNIGFGGASGRAWFKVNNLSRPRPDPEESEGLKKATAYVAKLLKDEPDNVMKGIAGYGIGGALALHLASLYAFRIFPIQIRAVVGINCWLPLEYKLSTTINHYPEARSRAKELPVLLTHGNYDNMVPYVTGRSSALALRKAGFQVKLKKIEDCDHAIVSQIMTEVSLWLTRKLELEGEPDTIV